VGFSHVLNPVRYFVRNNLLLSIIILLLVTVFTFLVVVDRFVATGVIASTHIVFG